MDKMKENVKYSTETKKVYFQEDSLISKNVALPYYKNTAFD